MFRRLRVFLLLPLPLLMVACPQTPPPEVVSVSSDSRVLNGTYSGKLSLDSEQVNLIGQSETAVYLTRSSIGAPTSALLAYEPRTGALLDSTEVGSGERYFYRSDDRLVRVRPGVAEVLDAASRQPLNRFEIGAGFTPDTGLYDGGQLILKRYSPSVTETAILSTLSGRLTPVPAGLSYPVTGYGANGSLASGDLLWWNGPWAATLTNIQTGASVSAASHHGNPCWYFNNPVSSSVSRNGRLFLSFVDGRVEVFAPDGQLEAVLIVNECRLSSLNPRLESLPEGIRVVSSGEPNRFALIDPSTLEFRWTETAPSMPQTAPYGVPDGSWDGETLYSWHAAGGQVLWTLPRTLLPLRLKVAATLDDRSAARPGDYRVSGSLEVSGRALDLDGTVSGYGAITAQFSLPPPPSFYLNATLSEGGAVVGRLIGQKLLDDRSAAQRLTLSLGNAGQSYSGVVKP